jgi:hypothetical protein
MLSRRPSLFLLRPGHEFVVARTGGSCYVHAWRREDRDSHCHQNPQRFRVRHNRKGEGGGGGGVYVGLNHIQAYLARLGSLLSLPSQGRRVHNLRALAGAGAANSRRAAHLRGAAACCARCRRGWRVDRRAAHQTKAVMQSLALSLWDADRERLAPKGPLGPHLVSTGAICGRRLGHAPRLLGQSLTRGARATSPRAGHSAVEASSARERQVVTPH